MRARGQRPTNYKLKTKNWIVGIDEAGRGPLAGPMVVGAVAIPSDQYRVFSGQYLAGIKDSKKLSPQKRNAWYQKILQRPACVCVSVSVNHASIDRSGVSSAARYAVAQCLKKISDHSALTTKHFEIFLDGGLFAPPEYRQKTIIKGDELVPIIAAASIIAKVRRDRMMVRLDKKYPHYGFAQHKGYGTRAHFAAIRKHGLSKIHRKSFCTRIV